VPWTEQHCLDDNKCQQYKEMASLLLEQMQANSKRITKKAKVCGSLPVSYGCHLLFIPDHW